LIARRHRLSGRPLYNWCSARKAALQAERMDFCRLGSSVRQRMIGRLRRVYARRARSRSVFPTVRVFASMRR
jgi:hypothetical protein